VEPRREQDLQSIDECKIRKVLLNDSAQVLMQTVAVVEGYTIRYGQMWIAAVVPPGQSAPQLRDRITRR
jgi:hypothetical protein